MNSALSTTNCVVTEEQLYMDFEVSVNPYSSGKQCGKVIMLLPAHVYVHGNYTQSCIQFTGTETIIHLSTEFLVARR